MVIQDIEVKDIMTKTNLPVSDFAVNPYVGCTHACKSKIWTAVRWEALPKSKIWTLPQERWKKIWQT